MIDDNDINRMIIVDYIKIFQDGNVLYSTYVYSVDDKTLKRGITIVINAADVGIESIIEKYLTNNYNKGQFFETLDNILYDQILKYWFQYSGS